VILKARVYWNFHRKCFSVQVNGRVVAHATDVVLFCPRFKVSARGRARVLREKRKNVHAFIYGEVASSWEVEKPYHMGYARYNPYANESFVDAFSGRAVHSAELAVCRAWDSGPSVQYYDVQVGGCARVRYST